LAVGGGFLLDDQETALSAAVINAFDLDAQEG